MEPHIRPWRTERCCMPRLALMAFLFAALRVSAGAAISPDLPPPPRCAVADLSLHSSSADWEQFVATEAPGWQAIWSRDQAAPMIAAGPPLALPNVPLNARDVLASGDAFLREHGSLLGIQSDNWIAGTPVLVNRIWMVPFRESVDGIAIYGGRIDLRITQSGKLAAFFARTHPDVTVATTPTVSEIACLRLLQSNRHFPAGLEMENSNLEILPTGDDGYLCWRMDVRGPQPDQRWTVWVDAHSGVLRAALSRIVNDQVTGNIQGEALPHYWNDPLVAYSFPWENVQVEGAWTVSDSLGHYSVTVPGTAPYDVHSLLSGPYVQVLYDDGPEASYDTLAPSTPHNWTWTASNSRTDERTLYHHMNLVHDFFKVLDPGFTGMDYPVPAVCEYGNSYENAFWNGYGTYYGGGGSQFRSFALFCDVIYHEYTHGVTDQIYPPGYLPYIDQSGAMNEAWSDYFACTITNEPLVGEGGLYLYGPAYLRNLDNTLRYPENWMGEVHDDGRIIGGAFWDLRERVGAEVSDHLIHFSKYGLSEDFLSYFIDVLLVDDDDGNLTNGSPHSLELYESFGIHGIGPGLVPSLSLANYYYNDDATPPSSGNNNTFLEADETIELWLAVQNQGMLYPPPAENVNVALNSLNNDVEIEQGQAAIGNLSAGQTRWISSPLLFHIAASAQDGFASLELVITANSGEVERRDTLEIMIGIPQILLADDDGGYPYETYYESGLHQINRTYVKRDVSSGISPEDLALHPIVLWFCGDQRTNTVSNDDQSQLVAHLNNGGRLILTGQNVGEDIQQSTFFQDVLGALHTDDSLTYRIVDGVEGDPIGDNEWLLLVGPPGAQNQNSVGGSHAAPDAVECFRFRDDPLERAGGIRREDPSGYRTIYCSFGMEGISGLAGSTPMSEFLSLCLAWLQDGMWTAPSRNDNAPSSWALLPAYPNPFNPATILTLAVPIVSDGDLTVFNLLGQRVAVIDQGPWDAGVHRIVWNAEGLPSGTYFVRLESPGVQIIRQVTLLR